jgi:hypothetical protein
LQSQVTRWVVGSSQIWLIQAATPPGFSVQATDLVGKRLELLGEIFFPICGVLDTALNSDEAG